MSDQFFYAIIAFVVLDLALVGWVIYRRSKPKLSAGEQDFIRRQWQMIISSPNQKQNILEADKLLDFVLGKYGYVGTLGEKMQKAGKVFSNSNGIWNAHKLRNRLAHELSYEPSQTEGQIALANFKQAFKDFKVKL